MKMPNKHSAPQCRPSLRMADGGILGSVRSMFAPETPEQQMTRINSKYAAQEASATARAQPSLLSRAGTAIAGAVPEMPSMPTPTVQPGYNGAGVAARMERGMKAAGLRDGGNLRTGYGGEVPGTGHGDKIPAKYEPGEFVVSNDMLNAQPGLEDHLHSLRDGVLQSQGKDPATVDAGQLRKAGLRALDGADPNALTVRPNFTIPDASPPPSTALTTVPNEATRIPGTGGPMPSAPATAAQGFGSKVGGMVKSVVNNPAVQKFGNAFSNLNALRLATESGQAADSGDYLGAADKGVSAIASTSAAGPVGAAYGVGHAIGEHVINPLLSNGTKDAIGGAINSGVRGLGRLAGQDWGTDDTALRGGSAAPAPTAAAPAPTAAPYTPSAGAFDPAARSLRQGATPASPFGTFQKASLQDYAGVDKDAEALRAAQSREGFMRDKDLADGMEASRLAKEQASYTNQAAESQSGLRAQAALDVERRRQWADAEMSSIDPRTAAIGREHKTALDSQGLEGQKQAGETTRSAAANAAALRNNAMTNETSLRNNAMTNETSLRTNRETTSAARAGHEMTARMNMLKLRQKQENTDREFSAGRSDAAHTQKLSGEKALQDEITTAHTTTGSDGKPVIDQGGANATRAGIDTMLSRQIADLHKSGTPQDLERAKNLSENSVNAMDPATRARAIAAVKLMGKLAAEGSNWNPMKPDFMGTTDPRDFIGMKKNSSGDFVTRNGKVVPGRFMAKQDADHFGGVPTNEYDILKGQ